MNKQSKKVDLGVKKHAALENNRAYLLRTEITESHLNNRICQHSGVKISTVTPSFYYVSNISLSCNINMPSFIGNLWWVLLLGNHLKLHGTQFFRVSRVACMFSWRTCLCHFVSKQRKLNLQRRGDVFDYKHARELRLSLIHFEY